MRRRTSRFILNGLGAIIAAVLVAVLIDYYHFSWTGYLFNKAGSCGYKTVTTAVENGFPQKLSGGFDLPNIVREMRKNPNYQVKGFYHNRGAIVARKFGNINYQVSFQDSRGTYEGFSFNTATDGAEYSFPSVFGEGCAAPNFKIKENVFAMIDELPLTDAQKAEMKESVSVGIVSGERYQRKL